MDFPLQMLPRLMSLSTDLKPSMPRDIGEIPLSPTKPQKSIRNEKSEKEEKNKKQEERERKQEGRADEKGHPDDPEYLERKCLKKEKKRMEKELAKFRTVELKPSSTDLQGLRKTMESEQYSSAAEFKKPEGAFDAEPSKGEATQTSTGTKLRIKLKRPNNVDSQPVADK